MADELGPLQPGLPSRTVGGGGGAPKGGKHRTPARKAPEAPEAREGNPTRAQLGPTHDGIIDEYA